MTKTLLPTRAVLALAGIVLAAALPAQIVFEENFTGGASTTGFTIESVDSDCDWIYAPGGLTPNAFNQDFGDTLPTGADFDSDFAFLDSDECGESGITVNSFLISPLFDASQGGSYRLRFSHQFKARLESFCRVEAFNGTDWTEVGYWTEENVGFPNPAVEEEIDITAATGGSPSAQVRFQFSAGWDWWWAIDAITVVRLDCTQPTASATVLEDCANDQFNVSVEVTDLGDATSLGIIANGTNVGTVTEPGSQLIGPYASLEDVTIVVAHTDPLCDLEIGTVTYNCGPCLNTDLFPEDTIAVDLTGDTLVIATNMYAGSEYNAIGGIVAGEQYEFTHAGGAYITVRELTYDGAVIGEGYSPLTVTAVNTGDLFVHYTLDDQCNTDATGSFEATVQLLIDTEIDELAAAGIRIYPNPTNSTLFVDLRGMAPVNIRVNDLLGHLVLEEAMTSRVDVSRLTNGTYLLTVLDAQGTVLARTRFAKQ
jgi:hypothetical protein